MKTNEIKKGARIKLRNGWEAEIADNARGNTRIATVYGHHTEMGSVYSHDIVRCLKVIDETMGGHSEWIDVVHTPAQLKLKQQAAALGM